MEIVRLAWRVIRRIRAPLLNFKGALARVCSGSKLGATLYYWMFPGIFAGEQQGVLAGVVRAGRGGGGDVSRDSYILRRNIHRLEKALCMRPRRALFGLGYIRETVEVYGRLAGEAGGAADVTELGWAREVLDEYFRVIGEQEKIAEVRRSFEAYRNSIAAGDTCLPFKAGLRKREERWGPMLGELLQYRKSVRYFRPKPVPRSVLDEAVLAAGQAPSACNRQPFYFRIFDDPGLVRRIASLAMGTEGYREGIPVLAVVVGQLRAFDSERDRHVIYIDASLASMNFMLSLAAAGVDTCCINWPDIPERETSLRQVLNLEEDERVIVMIAVGYCDPDGMVGGARRKPLGRLRRYNFE